MLRYFHEFTNGNVGQIRVSAIMYGWFVPQVVTGRRTVTLEASPSHCGPAQNEAELHIKQNKSLLVLVCMCKGMYAGDSLVRTR